MTPPGPQSAAQSISSPLELKDFRLFLQNEFVRRCKANPRYSLRAFAKFLQVDFSLLSKILRGQRPASKKMMAQVIERMGLSPSLLNDFQPSSSNVSVTSEYSNLAVDHFHLIADWYHFAIFELIAVKGFRSSTAWIAQRLGITPTEAEIAIERLKRLELLREAGRGRLERTTDHITTVGNPFTASAFRQLQRQVLEKGISALEELPMDVRDHSSMTMTVHSSKLPALKEKIKQFRRELCELAESAPEKDHVYQLGICFYPLTQIKS